MNCLLVYIRYGLAQQTISAYSVEGGNQLQILGEHKCEMENLEAKILELSNFYKTHYISILNDKEFEAELKNKYGFRTLEEMPK